MNNAKRAAILSASMALAVGGVVAASSLSDASHEVSQAVPQRELSSQEVFRAVAFGQGDLAQKLGEQPSLADFYRADFAANNGPNQLVATDAIVKQISATDPSYLPRFSSAVRSGNPFEVAKAIEGISPELQKLGITAHGIPEPTIRPFFSSSFNTNFQLNINIAINENFVVVINYFKVAARQASFSDPFQREMAIGQMTATLSA